MHVRPFCNYSYVVRGFVAEMYQSTNVARVSAPHFSQLSSDDTRTSVQTS